MGLWSVHLGLSCLPNHEKYISLVYEPPSLCLRLQQLEWTGTPKAFQLEMFASL